MKLPYEIVKNIYNYLYCSNHNKLCKMNTYLIKYDDISICKIHEKKSYMIIDYYIISLQYDGNIYLHESCNYTIDDILICIEKLNNCISGYYAIVGNCCDNTGVIIKYVNLS